MLDWQKAREEWDTRVRMFGPRGVYNIGHKTPEQLEAFTQLQRRTLLPALRQNLDGSEELVLDFGCGVGRWSGVLADEAKARWVLAVDPTEGFLEVARREQPHPLVSYELYRDGYIPTPDGTVDLLWSCLVLSTVLDEEMFRHTMTEFKRVLRPGGLLFVVDHTVGVHKSRWSKPRTAERYAEAFTWVLGAPVETLPAYDDLGDGHHIFVGRKR